MDIAIPDPDLAGAASPTDQMRARIVARLTYQVGKAPAVASERDWFVATALAVRDGVLNCWFDSTRRTRDVVGSALVTRSDCRCPRRPRPRGHR